MINNAATHEYYTNKAGIGDVIILDRKHYVVVKVKKNGVYQHTTARKLTDSGEYNKSGDVVNFYQSKHKDSGTRMVRVVDKMLVPEE